MSDEIVKNLVSQLENARMELHVNNEIVQELFTLSKTLRINLAHWMKEANDAKQQISALKEALKKQNESVQAAQVPPAEPCQDDAA